MRCLVLGGTGMLGRAVVREAREQGHEALGLSHALGDVTSRESLLSWADSFAPGVVINCAAFTKVDACETEPETAFRVNGEGVANAVAAADRTGARLLHVSSDYVFDGTAREPYQEDAATGPLSVYGKSKLLGERHALEYPQGLVVRTSWLFGPGGPNFAATMVNLIRQGKLPLRVVDDQVGRPTYTGFLARALVDLAPSKIAGIVHYGNREPVSWYSFAATIARLVSPEAQVLPVSTAEFPRPAPRPAYSVLAVDRFEAAVGRPVEPWEAGLSEYLVLLNGGRS
ncbi:MAG TPA: dTDP-4-dehydrorhamnose reductase [Thermoanaerobaculia bacterium]|nr:dTDP-4-dehydrorhamnose reductase [Thermoanaerobaculia bacterium]